jgi:hypothetical protein
VSLPDIPPAISAEVPDSLLFFGKDPAPGPSRTTTASRRLDCERMNARNGSSRYPGEIQPPPATTGHLDRTTVVCRERLLRDGLRAPLDEALLTDLQPNADALAETAASLRPDLRGATWLVEVFVPNPQVAVKVSFATKNALMYSGRHVSDRTPVLGAGDIGVITRMSPFEAYPTACVRWFATGAVGPGDAVLSVITLDPRETTLHAGLCVAGQWSWLR